MIEGKGSKFDYAWILAIIFSTVALSVFVPLSALAANSVTGTVSVINTTANPVPVTGVVTGTVSGSVEIKNTPSVNINNTPTVSIGNTAVPVTGTVNIGSMPSVMCVRFPIANQVKYIVPEGKTLTVEQVWGWCESLDADHIPSVSLRFGEYYDNKIPITSFIYNPSTNFVHYNQAMHANILAGEAFDAEFDTGKGEVGGCGTMWVSGYLQ